MLRALAARPQQPPAGRVGAFAQHRVRVACAARPVLSAGRPLEQAFFRAARRRGAARVVARAAALTEQELAKRALRLDAFDDRAVEQARRPPLLLPRSSGGVTHAPLARRRWRSCVPPWARTRTSATPTRPSGCCATASWTSRRQQPRCAAPATCGPPFLTAVPQVRAYAAWRATGFSGLTANDVAREAATGKARLLAQRDMVRLHASWSLPPRAQRCVPRSWVAPWCW